MFSYRFDAGLFLFFDPESGASLWSVPTYASAEQLRAELNAGGDPLYLIAGFCHVVIHPAGRALILSLPQWPE